jgi:hypothetical protein
MTVVLARTERPLTVLNQPVLVPAAGEMPDMAILAAILDSGFEPQVMMLEGDFAYGRVLAEVWEEPGDLYLVEHDIEVFPDTLISFEACPEIWCSAPYIVDGDLVDGIGCCRFREDARRLIVTPRGDLHWANVESAYLTALHGAGLRPHRHGEVIHHHVY